MKTRVLAFVVSMMFCAAVTSTWAVEANWLGNPRAEDTLKTFWQFVLRLEVTDAQKPQIKAAYEAQKQQNDTIRSNASLVQKDRQAQIDAVNRATHAKVMGMLTARQREQLQAMPGFAP